MIKEHSEKAIQILKSEWAFLILNQAPEKPVKAAVNNDTPYSEKRIV